MPTLITRWRKFWSKIDGRESQGDILFEDLIYRHAGPRRKYHTIEHPESMLVEFDDFRASTGSRFVNTAVVEAGTWYHDAEYHPFARDHERKGAELFCSIGEYFGLSDDLVRRVFRAILATKHANIANDLDAQVLCDLDLAIFGKPGTAFDEYERQIREEYIWVPEDRFRDERRSILQGFVARPSIYATSFFREKYERQARENLGRSIAKLSER
jgi:predicted metal-dependent HD superfamily phosphohydrolase